jgi:hypothetical protein
VLEHTWASEGHRGDTSAGERYARRIAGEGAPICRYADSSRGVVATRILVPTDKSIAIQDT